MQNRRKPRSISAPDALWDQVEHEAAASGQSVTAVVINALSRHFQSQNLRHSSWDTDDSDAWYDESKFYTFSQDKHGHSAKIDVTIPKMLAGEIAGLIDSGRIPELRTAQDFYRNAIRHWTYRTGKMLQDDGMIDASHTMTVQDRIATSRAITVQYEELETQMIDLLEEELTFERFDFVESELKAYWQAASSINERFRERYMEVLGEFQQKLKDARAVGVRLGRGTVIHPDGTRTKNGVELAPEKPRRRRSST